MKDKAQQSAENMAKLNQAHKEMIADQEIELIKDYDAAYEEWKTKDKPYIVKFQGKTFEVPRTQPFSYALFVSRHTQRVYNKDTGKEEARLIVPDEKGEEYIRLMLGDEFVKALAASGVEMDFVMDTITVDVHAMWMNNEVQKAKNALTPGS